MIQTAHLLKIARLNLKMAQKLNQISLKINQSGRKQLLKT